MQHPSQARALGWECLVNSQTQCDSMHNPIPVDALCLISLRDVFLLRGEDHFHRKFDDRFIGRVQGLAICCGGKVGRGVRDMPQVGQSQQLARS